MGKQEVVVRVVVENGLATQSPTAPSKDELKLAIDTVRNVVRNLNPGNVQQAFFWIISSLEWGLVVKDYEEAHDRALRGTKHLCDYLSERS